MQYLAVDEARRRTGLRLVVTVGMPGPWSESAKQLFHAGNVHFDPVAQYLNQENADLQDWTGVRNAPVAMFDDEPPRTQWHDILLLAERLSSTVALLPADAADRADALDVCHQICGPWGFGWCRRLTLLQLARRVVAIDAATLAIQRGYGYDDPESGDAAQRTAQILKMLAARLRLQHSRGSRYLAGSQFSAADLYWACFSLMVSPLPHEQAPMPPAVREFYSNVNPEIAAALDGLLIEHRDLVFERHLRLPLDF